MPSIKFDDLLAEKRRDPKMAELIDEETSNLEAAYALMKMRETLQISQEELAKKSGVSRITINRIEKGHASPTFKTLNTLAHAMNKKVHVTIS